MKILIMGEGPTDVGYIDNQTGFVEGPVCVLLRHMLGKNSDHIEFVFTEKADRKRDDKIRGKLDIVKDRFVLYMDKGNMHGGKRKKR